MNRYPFIEAEKTGKRNVKRACELLEVSRCGLFEVERGSGLEPTRM